MKRSVFLRGVGSAFPLRVKHNSNYEAHRAGVDADRLLRSGVKERRWSFPNETILDLGERACRRALTTAALRGSQVDRLLLVTSTLCPNILVPSGAAILKDRLGVQGPASTLLETCCGSLVAMDLGAGLISAGEAKHVLVVAAETFSKTFNPDSEVTFEIGMGMGDGAGAIVLSSMEEEEEDGLVAFYLRTSSDFQSGLGMRPLVQPGSGGTRSYMGFGRGSTPPTWQGHPLSRKSLVDALQWFTSTTVPAAIRGVLEKGNLTREQVDLFILHQPNRKFLDAWKKEAGISEEKTLDTLSHLGNLSSVSILANLDAAWQQGRLKWGDLVLLAAAGEGATWGASIWKWKMKPPRPGQSQGWMQGENRMQFQDRVVVVAGGSKGIGRAISKRFAEQGATVVVVARDPGAITDTVDELGADSARGVIADCTKSSDVKDMVARVVGEFGSIHVLINTIGGGEPESVVDTSDDLFDHMIALNVRSTFLLSRAVAPLMIRQGGGAIVHTSSVGAKMPSPGLAIYDGCKAFVVAFTRDLAMELGRFNINVNCVCPGHVPTEATETVGAKIAEITGMQPKQLMEMVMSRMAIPRFPATDEIAGLYLFLCSPDAACMTGQAINYSCGMEMR